MRYPFVTLSLASACSIAWALSGTMAQAAPMEVVPAKSQLGFAFKQMGVGAEGRFNKFTAQVRFDPSKPEATQASLEVDLNSVDAGSSDASDELRTKNWFNIGVFPSAKFVASSTKALGGQRFEIAGKLTIKGKTQDIVAPFTLKPGHVAEGQFVIKRTAFAIGEGEWADASVVAHDVTVTFKLQLQAAKP